MNIVQAAAQQEEPVLLNQNPQPENSAQAAMIAQQNQDQLAQNEELKVGSLPRDDVDANLLINASAQHEIDKVWYP